MGMCNRNLSAADDKSQVSSQQHHRVWTALEGQEQSRNRDTGRFPIRRPILFEFKEKGVSKFFCK